MKTKLFKGAIFVTIATFLVKVLSILYKIPYQNITGDKGFYIYQQLYPVYALIVTSASFAIPLAISEAINKNKKEKEILSSIFLILVFLSFILSFFIILFNKQLGIFFNDKNIYPLFYPLIPLLLLIPVISVIRGSLYSEINTLNKVGVSVIIEQFFRVSFIIFILFEYLNYKINNIYDVAKYSYFGFSIGVLISIMYVIFLFDYRKVKFLYFNFDTGFKLIKRGLFLLISASILILLQLVDSLTIINQLSKIISIEEAMNIKGVYDRGLPIIQTAIFFVSPLLSSMIPHITKKEDYTKLIMMIIFLSIPATFGLIYVIKDINLLLFLDAKYTNVLRINSFIVLLYSILLTLTSITINNKSIIIVIINGLIIKYLLNIILIYRYGIIGASISSVTSLIIMIIIIIWINKNKITFNYLLLIKIILSTIFMLLSIYLFSTYVINYLFINVLIGILSYLGMCFLLRIKKEEIIIN